MKKELTPFERHVLFEKGTEPPFSGEYVDYKAEGTYHCKNCDARLYLSKDKFSSGCGWPSFDDKIKGAVTRRLDADRQRIEITCNKCGAHLGHVFEDEGFTPKNIRHCVNSVSLVFVPQQLETAIFSGGCFWGVEHLFKQQQGVLRVESGYIGGSKANPTYQEVCSNTTGHAEAVKILFDPAVVSYETLAKLFFEIHDPTQTGGQGPDLGDQYRSEVFYTSTEQKTIAENLIQQLKGKGYNVATKVTAASTFYPAEAYHQDYYEKTGKESYCHFYTKRF